MATPIPSEFGTVGAHENAPRLGLFRARRPPHSVTVMGADYQFLSRWRVSGTIEEVKAILGDAEALRRWWPSVYLDVVLVDAGGPDGVGRTVDLHTKGWLPYTLRWRLRITEPVTDAGFALAATGDLEGTGRWEFHREGSEVMITYHWQVNVTKPLLRRLTWVLRPVFSANHRWAMARGEESLKLELQRRRAGEEQALGRFPDPPSATFTRLRRVLRLPVT